MEDEAGVGFEPANVGDRAIAAHDGDVRSLVRIPGEHGFAPNRPGPSSGYRENGKHDVFVGDDEVVHHAGERRPEAL